MDIEPRVATRERAHPYDPGMADSVVPGGAVVPPSAPLPPGTHVEARSSLDGTWQGGFVVAEATEDGYRLRRESDGEVLPALPRARVRRRRSRSTWWI